MKKTMNFAVVALMSVLCTALVGCSESYSEIERIAPDPKPAPTPTPDPQPSDTWHWSAIIDQTVNFDEKTEIVEANNIAQLTKGNEAKLDSATLRYQFGVAISAPTRVVTMSPDTTVYAGKGKDVKTYGEFTRQGSDSLRTVTTVVEGGFRSSYYTLGLTTSRKEGFSIHAGKWLAYKNVTESSLLTSIWHETIKEVELNDSIFNREVSHAVITITLTSDKGQKWNIQREKVVIVDHFLRIKEGEKKEEEHNHPSWWGEPIKIIGQGTFIYQPGVGPEGQGVFYKNINVLFENVVVCMRTSSCSTMDFNYSEADVYPIGTTLRGATITSKNVTDLNSMIWRDGKWEPAACTYDHANYSWSYVSPDGYDQGMTEHLAETCGLKNFTGDKTARLHPSLFYTASLSDGTLVIKDGNGVAFMSFH